MDLFSLLVGAIALSAAAAAGWAIRVANRPLDELRALVKVDREQIGAEVGALLKKAHAELGDLAEQVEEMISRARTERARADGRRGGRGNTADAVPDMTPSQYLAYLERGGKTIPELEARFG